MKFLFVAPRFHTNQFEIVKSLVDKGHYVEFFVQYLGKSEDYSIVKPYVMRKAIITILIHKLINFFLNANKGENIKVNSFIPEIFDLFYRIKKFKPDVVILRERNIVSMCAYFICKFLKVKSLIIYNQTPLYTSSEPELNSNILRTIKRFVRKYLFPKVRITTVCTRNITELRKKPNSFYINDHDYFVPFIAKANDEVSNRKYCHGGKINILDVGKFRDYKNHYLLVDSINLLPCKNNIKVTIVGQVSNSPENIYYSSLKKYINELRLDNIIKLEKNVNYNRMNQLYQKNDIFILPSKKEAASISILEAMSNGVITISTDANGTASYIKEGECGYVFQTNDKEDLARKINEIISNRDDIYKMGNAAYINITENYSFSNYYSSLNEIVQKEFGFSLDDKSQ